MFGIVRLGAALTKTGYQIAGSGSDISVNGTNLEDMGASGLSTIAKNLGAASGNKMTFEAAEIEGDASVQV